MTGGWRGRPLPGGRRCGGTAQLPILAPAASRGPGRRPRRRADAVAGAGRHRPFLGDCGAAGSYVGGSLLTGFAALAALLVGSALLFARGARPYAAPRRTCRTRAAGRMAHGRHPPANCRACSLALMALMLALGRQYRRLDHGRQASAATFLALARPAPRGRALRQCRRRRGGRAPGVLAGGRAPTRSCPSSAPRSRWRGPTRRAVRAGRPSRPSGDKLAPAAIHGPRRGTGLPRARASSSTNNSPALRVCRWAIRSTCPRPDPAGDGHLTPTYGNPQAQAIVNATPFSQRRFRPSPSTRFALRVPPTRTPPRARQPRCAEDFGLPTDAVINQGRRSSAFLLNVSRPDIPHHRGAQRADPRGWPGFSRCSPA